MKILTFITFCILTNSAFAKWQFLGTVSDEQGDRDEFYDDTPIGKGNFPKLWILRNYKKGYKDSAGDVYFSEKNLYEFSCKEREYRNRSMIQYADNFGQGNIIYNTSSNYQPKWYSIPPETTVDAWYKIVCK